MKSTMMNIRAGYTPESEEGARARLALWAPQDVEDGGCGGETGEAVYKIQDLSHKKY